MTDELDLRLLRHSVAVAEELLFTRAAARLYLAQQPSAATSPGWSSSSACAYSPAPPAGSPSPRRRPAAGARPRAARLHDQTLEELHGPEDRRPLLVDLLAEGHTPTRVLRAARQHAPHAEVVARFHGGFGAALQLLPAAGWTSRSAAAKARPAVPHRAAGPSPDPAGAAGAAAARRASARQPRRGPAGRADRHPEGLPILTLSERPLAPGVVVRPLTDPVPLDPWTMAHHRELRHPALDALRAGADQLARRECWLKPPSHHWIPDPNAVVFGFD